MIEGKNKYQFVFMGWIIGDGLWSVCGNKILIGDFVIFIQILLNNYQCFINKLFPVCSYLL